MSDTNMKYKYIHFVAIPMKDSLKDKYQSFECRNNKSKAVLGWVSYYPAWRQNVFTAAESWPVFNDSCLLDILDFMDKAETVKKRS